MKPHRGAPLALVFHDHPTDVDLPCQLSIIELQLSPDGHLGNLNVLPPIPVGQCAVDGHSGHHDIGFDSDRRRGVFTNPGDGTISLLSLEERKVIASFKVTGTPSKIVCVGGVATVD